MLRSLSHPSNTQWLVLFIAGIVFLVNLGGPKLFDEDEPKNAACGQEMFMRGDWIVPTFNHELRTDKPIMLYWLMLTSFSFLGVSEFSARLPSALMACGAVVTTFHLGKILLGNKSGLWGAIALSSCLMFVIVGRAATPDATLIFFTTLSLYLFAKGVARNHGGQFPSGQAEDAPGAKEWPHQFIASGWKSHFVMFVVMGLAVLAKGPVGFLLPCTIIGLFLLCSAEITGVNFDPSKSAAVNKSWWKRSLFFLGRFFGPHRFFRALMSMRPFLLFVTVVVVAVPWYAAVGFATNGAWLEGFLGGHNVGRFMNPMEGHSGPFFYYVPVIMMGFFPWSIFLVLTVWTSIKTAREFGSHRFGVLFLLCWVGVYLSFFSMAQTKLPNYVLPCYPALALLTGHFLSQWRLGEFNFNKKWFSLSFQTLAFVGIVMLVAFPIATSYVLPKYWPLGLVGLIPLFVGVRGYLQVQNSNRSAALSTMGFGSVALVVAMFGIATHSISQQQDGPIFGAISQNSTSQDKQPLATYGYFTPNLVFYANQKIERFHQPDQVENYFASKKNPLLIVRADKMDQLGGKLPKGVIVLEKKKQFLRRHELILLGRKDLNEEILRTATGLSTGEQTLLR